MGDDERQSVLVPGTDVNEVDVEAVDRGDELRQSVEACFGLAPVILACPVARQRLDGPQLYPLG